MDDRTGEVTRILRAGEGKISPELLPLVYGEMRVIARQRMGRERANHTLQATALVHEAYSRLLGDEEMSWRDRGHFFAAAAEAMRRVLIDHARKVGSQKRGGDRMRVTLGGPEAPVEMEVEGVLALNEALEVLGLLRVEFLHLLEHPRTDEFANGDPLLKELEVKGRL